MKKLTNEEYLELLSKLVEQQYDTIDELGPELDESGELQWISIDPEIKKEIKYARNQRFVNLTNVKKERIKDIILDNCNIIVGPFTVCITDYFRQTNGDINVLLYIYEENTRANVTQNKKVIYKIDIQKDMRFNTRPWIKYFNSFKQGNDVPADEVVEIIRWLQALNKLQVFL